MGEDLQKIATSQARTGLRVDVGLLKQQAAILGKVVDGAPLDHDERSCLEGLWEFVHALLDGVETGGQPTVVVFVEGGVVQGVEGNAPVRVLVQPLRAALTGELALALSKSRIPPSCAMPIPSRELPRPGCGKQVPQAGSRRRV